MNASFADKVIATVDRCGGIADYVDAGPKVIEMKVCCIGHADTVVLWLRGENYRVKQDGISITVFKPTPEKEPVVVRISHYVKDGNTFGCKVYFNSSVSSWAEVVAPIEKDADDYQAAIESVEGRVIKGIFGQTQPERIQVSWMDEALFIEWRP